MKTSPVLELVDIEKSFSGVKALKGVSLQVYPGEIHAIAGENGAGKSTLLKILAGALTPDAGKIYFKGEPVLIHSPLDSIRLGIGMIYQEFNLVPELSIMENIFLGRESRHSFFISQSKMREQTKKVLNQLGMHLDINRKVSSLRVAESQMVEIAKAISMNAQVLVMDEPSAALTVHDLEGLFKMIRFLKDSGKAVIYVTHRMEEIFDLCDKVTVLRDGRWIETYPVKEVSEEHLICAMVGRDISDQYPEAPLTVEKKPPILKLENIQTRSLKRVSLEISPGEILGIGGLVGSGRSAIGRVIFGLDKIKSGQFFWKGIEMIPHTPQQMVDEGIGMLTEDRKHLGLVMQMNIIQNISLASIEKISKLSWMNSKKEIERSEHYFKALHIKAPDLKALVSSLSGGNQQKVVLAKWLWRGCSLLIFDEPTRGIDVGAKAEIYQLMRDLSSQGVAILMISSDLPELFGMSDKVLVMRGGCIAGEINPKIDSPEKYLKFAMQEALEPKTCSAPEKYYVHS